MGGLARAEQKQWDQFCDYWQDLIEEWPNTKRIALYNAGKAVLQEVLANVDRRGVNDRHGRIKKWQELSLGTGGGYAKIAPDNEVWDSHGELAVQVTRYLERGHGIRKPSGRAERYTPRARTGRLYVPGHQFYSFAKLKAADIGIEAAQKALEELSDAIDDALYG